MEAYYVNPTPMSLPLITVAHQKIEAMTLVLG